MSFIESPAPQVIGSVDLAALSILPALKTIAADSYDEGQIMVHETDYTHAERVALRAGVKPFLDLGGSWLQADSRALSVSAAHTLVIPQTAQKAFGWHQDGASASYRAVSAASILPTQFAVGRLPYNTARHDHEQVTERTVTRALACGQLALFEGKVGDVEAFDHRVIHRSPVNEAAQAIDRLFVRVSTHASHPRPA